MGDRNHQKSAEALWSLVGRQHGVVTRGQLLGMGYSVKAIKHRVARGRFYPLWPGVYAVGRAQLTQHGRWMAAVLTCGPEAVLSHGSAAALWEVRREARREIEISIPARLIRRRRGIVVHRRQALTDADSCTHRSIPVTNPVCTLVDLAARLEPARLEAAVNEADRRALVNPESLRSALEGLGGRPGVARLRQLLDRRTFRLTDSELERRFLPLTRAAGLPPPRTGRYVNGYKVDFFWPELGLVVETDGLRYHRTAAQQERDRRRDQAHTAAGLTPLRFSHGQVMFEPERVVAMLATVARRLRKNEVA
jgi:very-short-patch-repair endonuclease